MPTKKLAFRPGINTQLTALANEGGFSSGNLVRFKDGLAERYAGWEKLFTTTCVGLVRDLHAYQDLSLANTLLLGTDGGAQIYVDGVLYDFVLARHTSTLTAPWWTATAGSSVITVTDVGHGATAGDAIQNVITTAAQSFGAATPIWWAGRYTILSVVDADHYTVNIGTVAGNNTSGGYVPTFFPNWPGQLSPGEVGCFVANSTVAIGNTFTVDVPTQVADQVLVGPYTVTRYDGVLMVLDTPFTYSGTGTWYENGNNITGYGQVIYYEGAPATPQNWFMDNLGQNGLVNLDGQGIYEYTPPVPANGVPVATLITTAPGVNSGMFTAMPQAQVIAFGSEAVIGGGTQDPLLVRFSDAGSDSIWIATSTNQAGSYRLSRGSRIVGGIQAPQTTVLWTDVDAWTMVYIGPPLIYSFTIIGSGCGLISPKARAVVGRTTYWMDHLSFWQLADGGVQPLECDVWDYVFGDLDLANADKSFAAATAARHEVAFYFPSLSGGTGEIDSYVRLNVMTMKWDCGRLGRTAWLDSNVFGYALGADLNRHVQKHEIGFNADGVAMSGAYVQTGYFEMMDGDQLLFIDRIFPNFKWLGMNGYVAITVFATNSPDDPRPVIYGPFTATPQTKQIPCNVRKRYVAFRFEFGELTGFNARINTPTVRVAPSGKAP